MADIALLASFIFIELSDSSSCDDLTLGGFSMKLPIANSQCNASQLPQPSSPAGNIQSIVSYLHAMALPGHTSNELQNLDYNKIPLQKFNSCQLLLMEMSFLSCHSCF